MSILKYFNKHHGYDVHGKRTPFGGGGGDIFQSVGNALASIDPGPSIGNALAEVDKGVNQIPGGWITVGGLAAGGLALAYAPEVMAFAEANGLTPAAASTELGIAPVNAATGEVVAPDVFAGLSANAPVDTSLSQAAAASMGGAAAASATQALPYSEVFDAANLAKQGLDAAAIEQNITATGMNSFLSQDIAQMAASGLSPEAIAQNLAYSYSPSELAGTGIQSMQAGGGVSASDVLTNASRAKNIANLLNLSATSGLTSSLGKLAQGAHPYGAEQLQVVRGNKSPFTYQPEAPIQNKPSDLASLVQLLKQG